MVTSIIQFNVARKKINDVAEKLAELNEITEVYSVSGNYDLIAIARVANHDEIAELVTNKLCLIDDILKTETILAYRAYSNHDLEGMFSIGM